MKRSVLLMVMFLSYPSFTGLLEAQEIRIGAVTVTLEAEATEVIEELRRR